MSLIHRLTWLEFVSTLCTQMYVHKQYHFIICPHFNICILSILSYFQGNLFTPFIINKAINNGYVHTIQQNIYYVQTEEEGRNSFCCLNIFQLLSLHHILIIIFLICLARLSSRCHFLKAVCEAHEPTDSTFSQQLDTNDHEESAMK